MPLINNISISDAEFTSMQEIAAAFILEQVFKHDKKFTNPVSILKDKDTKSRLIHIFSHRSKSLFKFDIPTDEKTWLKSAEGKWVNTLYLQQAKMLKVYPLAKFTTFNREGGFMKFISDLVKTKFKISKKDAWNPADIWLISGDQTDIETKINNSFDAPAGTQNISELNTILRSMFRKKIVVGISLKLISGKEAKWEQINVTEKYFKNLENFSGEYSYTLSKIVLKLNLNQTSTSFMTQDTVVFLKDSTGKDVIKFQIKGNSTSDYSNLKIEGTLIGSSSARLGKAPLDLVQKLSSGVDSSLFNTTTRKSQNYAKDVTEFILDKKRYKEQFKILLDSDFVDQLGIKTETEFETNMISVFNGTMKHIANNKLQQIYFISRILNLDEKDRNNYLTDLAFLSQKMGRKVIEFGPFGKLY